MKLYDFNAGAGDVPEAGLIADAAGNLFGTTQQGGAFGGGTAFELGNVGGGAWDFNTLASFTHIDGASLGPDGGLIADANGNLFGTTQQGGAFGLGSVFEIPKTATGFASTPITLASFDHQNGVWPEATLTMDAAGDLFGTTLRGGNANGGGVFELARNGAGYATTTTALLSFDGPNGADPGAGLIADGNGDLFGTTEYGGAAGGGIVFELVNNGGGNYTATTLANFNGMNGQLPSAGLFMDAQGNLLGTTSQGGADGAGTVFEIARTAGGYAGAPTILENFDGTDGRSPQSALIANAAGDLFGTTASGGANNDGTVFEIAVNGDGYVTGVSTVFAFNGANGATPVGTLLSDGSGDLLGATAAGGANNAGTVFELTGTGFQTSAASPPPPDQPPPTQLPPTPPPPGSDTIVVNAMGTPAGGTNAHFNLIVDGSLVGQATVTSTEQAYNFSTTLAPGGSHDIQIAYDNDAVINGEDRNLFVQSLTIDGQTVNATSPLEVYHAPSNPGPGDIVGSGNMYWNGIAEFSLPASFFATSPPPSAPSSIVVGGDSQYTTIQQGIQAAEQAGVHSLVINPGTYTENDTLTEADNGLTISAASGGVTLAGSVNVDGASAITVSGLTFLGDGSGVALTALNSQHLTITDDSFAGTGEAVLLDGTSSSVVSDNLMTNTTNSAIEAKNGANGNTFDSNVINGDTTADTIGAIWLHGAGDSTITHNQISNTTGAAISLADFSASGSATTRNDNSMIADNSLNQVDTQSQDSGAIYILGRSQDPATGITVKMNFIGTIGSPTSEHAVDIYLDDNTSGVSATRNIVRAMTSAMSDPYEIHGGSNNTISGNIFDLGTGHTTFGLFQQDESDQLPSGTFSQLTNDKIAGNVFVTESTAPHDPGFGDLTGGLGDISISGNDFWAYSNVALNVGGTGAQGDSAAVYNPPAAAAAGSMSDYATWAGAGINFAAIDTSQIGLAPTGPHPY